MWTVLGLACAAFLAVGGMGVALQGPKYNGPATPHFDGRRFGNPGLVRDQSALQVLKFLPQWVRRGKYGVWEDRRGGAPGPKPVERIEGQALRMTWINHATVLLQTEGLNLLTDPIWSDRCSPFQFAGPRRMRDPAVPFEDLPPIDEVLISHNHYDHLDKDTLLRLEERDHPRFIVPLGNAPLLRGWGLQRVVEMDWWDQEILGERVVVHCTPAQHFSSRGLGDRNRTLWAGYWVETPSGGVFFAGDTGYGPHFADIRERFGSPRLALLPAGAYRPRWFMSPVHMGPEEAIRAHDDLGARVSQIIHFGTFNLGLDGMDEAGQRVVELSQGSDRRFWVGPEGATRDFPETD